MTGTGARLLPLSGEDPGELGPYRLLVRLAAGGMGRVYLARSTADDGLVAVKSLLAEGVISDVDRRRFAREVLLARRINSAHTARVRAADAAAERPWMAIDYIPAPSLAELVRVAGVLPARAACWVAAGIAAALFTLHREGIVHRDVKPQNILLPGSGARVIDFGISHATDLTRTSLTLGTIAFTSPEQARGEPSTAASDVYSFGATLFHLAVGRSPYPEGEDTLQLLARVGRGEIDATGLPAALEDVVLHCLSLEPTQRPGPDELLARFTTELAAPSASQPGRHWLPGSWAQLMAAYERQGAELAATLGREAKGTPPRPARAPGTPVPSTSPAPPTAVAQEAVAQAAVAPPAVVQIEQQPVVVQPANARPAPAPPAARNPPAQTPLAQTPPVPAVDTRPVPRSAPRAPRRSRASTRTPRSTPSTAPNPSAPPAPPAAGSGVPSPRTAEHRALVDRAPSPAEEAPAEAPPAEAPIEAPVRTPVETPVEARVTGPVRGERPEPGAQPRPRRPVELHHYPAPPPAPIRCYPVVPAAPRYTELNPRARWLLGCAVALVLVLVGVLLVTLSDDADGGGDDRSSSSATSSARPIDRARHTDVGDCLAASFQSVEAVSCDSERASWRVVLARTEKYSGAPITMCPTGPGRQSSEYIDATRLRTLLCLQSL
ncbi:serine/threonine-protein kinase [Streptomyces sp. NPDC059076]|uniref:serine/threonine-protein kinase n=1 Tax=unclassified Streptomyces TaxID=2593676 RepID=UPI0036C0DB94